MRFAVRPDELGQNQGYCEGSVLYSEWWRIAPLRPMSSQTIFMLGTRLSRRIVLPYASLVPLSCQASSAPPPPDIVDLTLLEPKKVDSALAEISHKPIRLAIPSVNWWPDSCMLTSFVTILFIPHSLLLAAGISYRNAVDPACST